MKIAEIIRADTGVETGDRQRGVRDSITGSIDITKLYDFSTLGGRPVSTRRQLLRGDGNRQQDERCPCQQNLDRSLMMVMVCLATALYASGPTLTRPGIRARSGSMEASAVRDGE